MMHKLLLLKWVAVTMLLTAGQSVCAVNVTDIQSKSAGEQYEAQVLAIVELVQTGEMDKALALSEAHIKAFPTSRIIKLVRADILTAMSLQLSDAPSKKQSEKQSTSISGLQAQIKSRWQHYQREQKENNALIPASLVDMGRHEYALVADMQAGRLYLYGKQKDKQGDEWPVLIKDYYLSVGAAGYGKQTEGDNKTPIGLYSIYKHIDSAALPDLYGKGAFPVDYPNRYDRSLKRTGYGIWLHGTPSATYARPPWASEGCFVISNDDLIDIQQYLDVGSRPPVILSDAINWVSLAQLKNQQQDYLKVLADWQSDWESLDVQAYLSNYSKDNFNMGSSSFRSFAKRKIAVSKAKTFVQVDLQIESLFLYPGVKDMFVVNYKQRYFSNNYAGQADKQQYWQRNEQGQWKIIYEG